MNQLELFFSPNIPDTLRTVPLAFVTAPTLQRDLAVAVLSAQRYVRENYPHVRDLQLPIPVVPASGQIHAIYNGFNSPAGEAGLNAWTFSDTVPDFSNYALKALCSPITVEGLYLSEAGSWLPQIKPGLLWRRYNVREQEFNTGTTVGPTGTLSIPASAQNSWLARSGLLPGDSVLLLYAVPERGYGTVSANPARGLLGTHALTRRIQEQGTVVASNKIKVQSEVLGVYSIVVNGTERYSGQYYGEPDNATIASLDTQMRTITVRESLPPDARVVVEFCTPADRYIYRGYRDWQNAWYTFDANPEYGHAIRNPITGEYMDASLCLAQQVTLYTLPTAYVKVNSTLVDNQVSVTLTFESAFKWGETHFVRHTVGESEEDIQVRLLDGPINTWGYAVCGRNYFDEPVGLTDDVFSDTIPSMIPLAKLVLTAPAALDTVAKADVRRRGGGVPHDYPFSAVTTNASGLDLLRSYYDLGTWNGAAVSQGGVVEIQINSSELLNFTHDEIVRAVQMLLTPGVDYEIVYKDDV